LQRYTNVLAKYCNCIAKFGYCHDVMCVVVVVVCLSSVMLVYCDKVTEARNTRFSLKVAHSLIRLAMKFEGDPLDWALQTMVKWLVLDFACSRS